MNAGEALALFNCTRLRSYPHPNPAPHSGPRLRRGRSKARAPVAPKPCLLAPEGERLCILSDSPGRTASSSSRTA
ncbi:hypothetical protein XarbCFBP6827_02370 [Xanthomonas arboricola]|nr:hypothetical protein XarbCFBP6827_02370 [Xanthomonas arboricola]